MGWLATPEQQGVRRAFTVWLREVLLPARLPGVIIPEIDDLREVKAMLAVMVGNSGRGNGNNAGCSRACSRDFSRGKLDCCSNCYTSALASYRLG